MTDVVYTLGTDSFWKDREIMFSLRSIEKYLKGYRNIYIVGHLSNTLTNVIHIPAKDEYKNPDANIAGKIIKACETTEISDTFLFFNDDHYLLRNFDADDFPYFHHPHDLEKYAKRRGSDAYGRRAVNTLNHLKQNSKEVKHFDIHFPILYEKKAFLDIFKPLDLNKGYIIKSLYANMMGIQGEEIEDCKDSRAPGKRAICFSTMPKVSAAVDRFLEYRFPDKSKYEL